MVEEKEYVLLKCLSRGIKVSKLSLICREGKRITIRRINRCYKRLAEYHNIPFVKTKKCRFKNDISTDGFHSRPGKIRQGTSFQNSSE